MDELAQSMGRVIPLASAYGVEMDQLATGYAELTKGGIATAEATTYLKGMFTELGSTSSEVSGILLEQTGSTFTQLMESGMSLGDVMQVLGDSVNGDATAFANLWSSQEAGVGALALYNAGAQQFNGTLAEMQASAGATADAYDILNNTLADAMEDLQTALSNLTTAIGDALAPAFEVMVGVITDIVNALGEWISENPAVVSTVTAVIGVIAAACIGVVAYTGVVKLATVATGTFGTAINTVFWPITLVAAAIAGLTVAWSSYVESVEQADEGIRTLTPTCQEQLGQIHQMEDELRELEDSGQGATQQAAELRGEIEAQRAAFEGTRETMDDYVARMDEFAQEMSDWGDSVDEQLRTMDAANASSSAYLGVLQRLAAQSDGSVHSQQMLAAAYGRLQEMYPDMSVSLEEFTSNTEQASEAIEKQIESANEQAKMAAYMDKITEASKNQIEAEIELADATEQYTKAKEKLDAELAKPQGQQNQQEISRLTEDFVHAEDALNDAQGAYDDASDALAKVQDAAADCAQAQADLTDSLSDQDQAFAMADSVLGEYRTQLEAVAESQEKAVESARQTLDSQFGMFEAFKNEAQVSLSGMQSAMQSNLDSMASYEANLNVLDSTTAASVGATEEGWSKIKAAAAEGSPEAMALAQQAVDAINEGNTEALESIANLAEALDQQRQTLADKMGEMKNETDLKMQEITTSIKTESANWDASAEAVGAVQNMMGNVASAISSSGGNALSALDSIISQARAKMSTLGSITSSAGSTVVSHSGSTHYTPKGYARGTLSAPEDIFLAGEEGPELIVGAKGSRVFPANETADILGALERIAPLPEQADTTTLANILEPAEDGAPVLSLAREADELRESVEALNEPGRLAKLVQAMRSARSAYMERQEAGIPGALSTLVADVRDAVTEYRATDPVITPPDPPEHPAASGLTRDDVDAWWADQAASEWYDRAGAPTFETLYHSMETGAIEARDAGGSLLDMVRATWTKPMSLVPELPSLPNLPRMDDAPRVPARGSEDVPDVPETRRQTEYASGARQSESTLHIDFGDGRLVVPKSLSLEDVHAAIMEQTGPALMRCLKQEAFEEGEGAYVF